MKNSRNLQDHACLTYYPRRVKSEKWSGLHAAGWIDNGVPQNPPPSPVTLASLQRVQQSPEIRMKLNQTKQLFHILPQLSAVKSRHETPQSPFPRKHPSPYPSDPSSALDPSPRFGRQ